MTDKELKKLGKRELLELLYFMRKEIDALKDENELLKHKLEKNEQALKIDEILAVSKDNAEKLEFLKGKFL